MNKEQGEWLNNYSFFVFLFVCVLLFKGLYLNKKKKTGGMLNEKSNTREY